MIMLLTVVTLYGLGVTGCFVAASARPRGRVLLTTIGVLGVLAPLALVAFLIWDLANHPIQIG